MWENTFDLTLQFMILFILFRILKFDVSFSFWTNRQEDIDAHRVWTLDKTQYPRNEWILKVLVHVPSTQTYKATANISIILWFSTPAVKSMNEENFNTILILFRAWPTRWKILLLLFVVLYLNILWRMKNHTEIFLSLHGSRISTTN